ncbi:MAG: NUDIX hydrolase [Holophaga sp.]|nr:NUDIX hydrolase [Holophaga sp.]
MKTCGIQLLLAGLLWGLGGCGGGGGHQEAKSGATPPAPPRAVIPNPPADQDDGFTFNPQAPNANPLPYDPQDVAQSMVSRQGNRDGAGVFVYATHNGQTFVLLARRAPWLGSPGTWGVFGGSVETTDLDSAGRMSYSRAAEHELYEESVTVYHQTDAVALRACPSHIKQWNSGLRFRTFFSRQRYYPESRFNQGYAYAIQHRLARKYQENDEYRWVRLDDLQACAHARARSHAFRDGTGASHTLQLFNGFYRALIDPGYIAQMNALP